MDTRIASQAQGQVVPSFENVREAFAENFRSRHELGGACCCYYRGEKVVDLWGGVRNKSTGEPWERDTMVIVYSATKGLAAMAQSHACEPRRSRHGPTGREHRLERSSRRNPARSPTASPHDPLSRERDHRPACVITTTWSRTVILPTRDAVLSLAATANGTGLSPLRGMPLVIVIHGTSDTAVQIQRSCVAPPQVFGTLC